MSESIITHIEAPKGWQLLNLKEMIGYRDLFIFLVWRNIKVLYAQTILGFTWAILQPTIQIVIFTVIFGKVAKLDTDGIPYALFSSVAIIPWTYITQSMSQSSQSMVAGQHMLGKVYFPRLIFPLAPILSNLVSFCISLSVLLCLFIYYRVPPTWNILMLPLFVIYMICISAGAGMWLSALAIRFRDVKHAMPFTIRMLMYTAPIVYSASSLSGQYRLLYSLNPLVGVIEGYRACFLGTPFPWTHIVPGICTTLLILISGAYYFKRMERVFVDVI
jgi:lipopolysaccharide transport system permease protein